MRFMKILLLAAFIGAVLQAPGLRTSAQNGLARLVGPKAAATASDQATYNRLCPLFDAYLSIDGTGKRATAKAIGTLAQQAATQTDDPAVQAFLHTVPVALHASNSAQQRAAKALVARECAAHDKPLNENK